MEYSAESLRYLHIAYTVMAAGQMAYVARLIARWRQTSRELSRLGRDR